MSIESSPQGEFLHADQFVVWALGKLGVQNTDELTPAQKVGIGLAFHLSECEKDQVVRVPSLSTNNEEQTRDITDLLVWRGSQMLTMLEKLVGFEGDGRDFDETLDALDI